MSQFFYIHPDNPQPRLIKQAVEMVHKGAVIVYPTDSSYALGCHLDDKAAVDRIRQIREVDERHHLTLVCRDLSELATFAKVDNAQFRLIKGCTPGPFTFILNATRDVPRRLVHPKRLTIGLRVPDNAVAQALLQELDAPLLSSTLIMPGDDMALNDPEEIRDRLEHQVDLILNAGSCEMDSTTVIDLTGDEPVLLRRGRGDVSSFGLAE